MTCRCLKNLCHWKRWLFFDNLVRGKFTTLAPKKRGLKKNGVEGGLYVRRKSHFVYLSELLINLIYQNNLSI
jgi:hypothetical protein